MDIGASKALEITLREALSVLQKRFDEQRDELDAAKKLETTLLEAQAVLERSLEGYRRN